MKSPVPIVAAGETRFAVETSHTVQFPGAPPVLSTPSLIWFLEHAAIAVLEPFLEPGEVSLGTEVEIEHLAPTPPGFQVVCKARVIRTDGPKISFQVEAHDGQELIARGFHRRVVVRAAAFARRVGKKQGGGAPSSGEADR
jgi:fluoroacetyl-CoA thioesterase